MIEPMEVTQTKAEGLSRTFAVKVPASELQAKLDERIEEIRPQMKLKGFRPGKVPASHVRKLYGQDLMGELINKLVTETNQKALEDNELRPAGQPDVQIDGDMEAVVKGQADLSYNMNVDVMPEFEPADVTKLTITRPVADVAQEQIDEALGRIAEQNTQYEPRAKTAKAKEGDAVVMDFVGKIDGEAFEGGSAEQQTLVIGSGQFIPGFEDQLVGVKAGDEKDVTVTFPEEYGAADLAGKEAVFEVKVHEVRAPKTAELDDEFAKGLGLESLEQLTGLVKDQLKAEHDGASRAKAKRNLLDQLDEAHSFDLPPNMVEQEFNQIWQQLQSEMDAGRTADEDKDKSEDELKEEYRKIAERRVRLGLVLAEIGRVADVRISEQEVNQALVREARQYPGQETQVVEFFRNNPGAMAQLRAPIYEDKVVDHILEVAEITEETVSREDLFKEEDE
ncbi:trigger factor [Hyphomonas sp. L-53-1-40]|jgi:trigger factor|uniref:peptidylprolyl isomerase n=5 Tax=root TaxID=1 RepID=A0A7S0VPV9_9CRYP|nr:MULTISPECIES: trigger factor [unclassified Hyphomonas]KCZ65464.1 trigger factor [Hyphomonas sp. L-53-1-40]MDF1804791.1 trigger factor [Hyphomonas sp.]|tara:strand:- start:8717 stop:10066 length:1350 start_codon:yes stop_codon:yes gene_type:complete|mmetsp:Transcript_21306/g.53702  ORF Transcript_21306/g.53702 Transcript_21306/m.53702 type:complete len:450 (+) Transcript_21306:44-1393(+)